MLDAPDDLACHGLSLQPTQPLPDVVLEVLARAFCVVANVLGVRGIILGLLRAGLVLTGALTFGFGVVVVAGFFIYNV